ncbi:MAG: hypothetical protein AAF225_00165 [Pseudomonadota bacterium]
MGRPFDLLHWRIRYWVFRQCRQFQRDLALERSPKGVGAVGVVINFAGVLAVAAFAGQAPHRVKAVAGLLWALRVATAAQAFDQKPFCRIGRWPRGAYL